MRYHELVRQVQKQGGFDSPEEAVTAIRATLSSLGECLYRTQRRHLVSQLPKEVKDFVHEYVDSEVTRAAVGCHTLEEFYDRVGARAGVTRGRAVERARVVASVLRQSLPEGAWDPVAEALPKEYAEVWGEVPPEPASPTRA
ncbi:MAG: DUF2267 domain-containing protein [Chloroflexota bacterium]|nr:DUF2267 domain-containing protein [Chloroflexota bacterium]